MQRSRLFRNRLLLVKVLPLVALISLLTPFRAVSSCSVPANAIEAENCQAGTPQSTWDLSGKDAGDLTIQGFTTQISVVPGETIFFKVKTPASAWRLDIYRLGYYGGNGARLMATVTPSVPLPQSQPACLNNSATGLTDCGNWSVSASWTVPAGATSGIYFAKATRNDTGGASHIVFVVRNDSSHSDILFQTSDTTWQAYNNYGGNDFYTGPFCNNGYCRAFKLSYNRPFLTRSVEPQTWLFNAEYPMVRWLEANGYDVTYFSGIDTDRYGSLLLNHKVWISNGHDEYWSGNQRTNVEAARAAGVNLSFFSGNSVYWKTRWESSTDGSSTPYRTLACYKETWANAVIDPADPPTWTGTWRDPRFSPPADGGRPENALKGSLTRFADSYRGGPMTVPQSDGRMRFWRSTGIAALSPGQTATLVPGTLHDELDMDEDNGWRPPGLFHLSSTPVTSPSCLLDYGTTTGTCSTTHNMTLYRYAGLGLVFSAGTYEWAWGLDANHDQGSAGSTTNVNMKQATVNLFADMGVQPATLQTGLVRATASTDHTPPTSTINAPASGLSFPVGSSINVAGTAADSGGVVGGVEVSTDGGVTWHPATGRESWSYSWTATIGGPTTILSRAADDSGNLENPGPGSNITISGPSAYSLWPTTIPGVIDSGPDSAVELGVKFRSDTAGQVLGIRFYKAAGNTGTHQGNLWSASGTLLATATFTGESASGWQQVLFSTPVTISANTVYVASYHTNGGHYSDDQFYFSGNGADAPPLHALADGISGVDGVFAYGAASAFPNQGWNASNYWVDLLFKPSSTLPPSLTTLRVTPSGATIAVGSTQQFTATGTYSDGSSQNLTGQATWTSSATAIATINSTGLATAIGAGSSTISATVSGITGSTTLTVQGAGLSVTNSSLPGALLNQPYSASLTASGGTTPYAWSIATGSLPTGLTLNSSTGAISGTPSATGSFSFTARVTDSSTPKLTASKTLGITVAAQSTIWPATAVPQLVDSGPDSAVELGVKFRSDVSGFITAVRFYKAAANTGTHVAHLWSSSGTLLATATFTGESGSGWQQVSFATPVAINANTVYIASYHTNTGHYSDDQNFFLGKGVDAPPLHALADGVSSFNGVFAYGSSTLFPRNGWNSSNYWVDVVFRR